LAVGCGCFGARCKSGKRDMVERGYWRVLETGGSLRRLVVVVPGSAPGVPVGANGIKKGWRRTGVKGMGRRVQCGEGRGDGAGDHSGTVATDARVILCDRTAQDMIF
jgi:hypothetical protein